MGRDCSGCGRACGELWWAFDGRATSPVAWLRTRGLSGFAGSVPPTSCLLLVPRVALRSAVIRARDCGIELREDAVRILAIDPHVAIVVRLEHVRFVDLG